MTQQVGRALSTRNDRGVMTKTNNRVGGKEPYNLVLDLGNATEKTITDMQRAFVQAIK